MTLDELAKELGTSSFTLANMLCGSTQPLAEETETQIRRLWAEVLAEKHRAEEIGKLGMY